jgi:lipoprotein signal peptidase
MQKIRPLIIFIGGFFLFILDQIVKQLALNIFIENRLWLNILGWHPFKNSGIAFSLPLPNSLTVLLTIPTLLIILVLLWNFRKHPKHYHYFFGLCLIFWGAASNLFDRIFYKTTIDYFLIGTGVINTADILIIFGFIIVFSKQLFKK